MQENNIIEKKKITDQEFLDIFLSKQNHLKILLLNKPFNKEYKEWALNRFKDLSTEDDLREIMCRIRLGLEERPRCPQCGAEIPFEGGYKTFCSKRCQVRYNSPARVATFKERYGTTSPWGLPKAIETKKKTNLERYGTECTFQVETCKEKIKATNLKRYGSEYPLGSKIIKEKSKKTWMEKYGADNPMRCEEIKNKVAQTCLERYGDTCVFGSNSSILESRVKASMIEKYGTRIPLKNEEIKEKMFQTNLEKYGTRCSLANPEVREKGIQTLLERYNVTNGWLIPEVRAKIDYEKVNETRRKNGTFNTSEPERLLGELLRAEFGEDDVIPQYKSEAYPWLSDYYIKSLDFYIELQGFYTHGTHPFTSTDEDFQIIEDFSTKISEERVQGLIDIWVISDVIKRNRALEQGLNFLEIFDIRIENIIQEVLDIVKNQKGYQLILKV